MCSPVRQITLVCLACLTLDVSAQDLPTTEASAPDALVQDASAESGSEARLSEDDASVAVVLAQDDEGVATSATEVSAQDATVADASLQNPIDPFQAVNKATFAFNEFADRIVLRPLATLYAAVMPDVLARGVHNALENLGQPAVVVNQLLQAKPALAINDAGRFLLNTTVGLVGLVDVAAQLGLPPHNEDFGQTLGVWGFPQGPFLMLPLLGPSTSTAAAGSVVDMLFRPTMWLKSTRVRVAVGAVGAVDTRVQLLEADGLITGDRYAFIRDAYVQRRNYLQADGVVDDPFLDDAEDE